MSSKWNEWEQEFTVVMQIIIQNHCTVKVTESKKGSNSNIFDHKIILGSNIYTGLLFLHILTECDTTFSINGLGRATVL